MGGDGGDGNDGDDDQQDPDDEEVGDDFQDHINQSNNGGASTMETDSTTPVTKPVGKSAGKTVAGEASQTKILEKSVMRKVLDLEKPNTTIVSSGPRAVEENIGVHLLQRFNAESDDEEKRWI